MDQQSVRRRYNGLREDLPIDAVRKLPGGGIAFP